MSNSAHYASSVIAEAEAKQTLAVRHRNGRACWMLRDGMTMLRRPCPLCTRCPCRWGVVFYADQPIGTGLTVATTQEQNERLTRVGPGTPMGDLLRRCPWIQIRRERVGYEAFRGRGERRPAPVGAAG